MLEQFHTFAACFLSLSQSSQAFWYILPQEQMQCLLAGKRNCSDYTVTVLLFSGVNSTSALP